VKRRQSAGRGRAREHGVEPVVIGFVERMVRGADGWIQLAKAGFGRLSNARLNLVFGQSGGLLQANLYKLISGKQQKVANRC
jgi:hypothetical protein